MRELVNSMIGMNIYWKKIGSDVENVTFIMAESYEDGWNKVLKMKGGPSKITIIKAQEYYRLNKCLVGEPVYYQS